LPTQVAKFDLTIELRAAEDGFVGGLEYAVDLFDRVTAQRIAKAFVRLLDRMVAQPDAAAMELSILSEEERALTRAWNQTTVDLPPPGLLHELFEAQVDATPAAIALVSPDGPLTYGALEARANQLAHRLREQGVGPEVVVALSMDRSIDQVIGVLGILKAGGAYLPLDQDYPEERRRYMIEDSGARVIVARRRHAEAVLPDRHVIYVDELGEAPTTRPRGVPRWPEALAYVIYTSGSTGQPKAVQVSHAAIVNRVRCSVREHPLEARDCVLCNTPLSFDVATWEIFASQSTGARLAIPGEARADLAALARWMAEQRVTVTNVVPSVFSSLLEQQALADCVDLRSIFCGGEAMPQGLVAKTRRVLPQVRLFNYYGPTETAVDATRWPCDEEPRTSTAPIGSPLGNVQAHVLESSLERTPIGVNGELYLGGAQVARGYLARPALTAERFIPDALAERPGQRMYRTGDKARWLIDGAIEYRGRVDHQIKLNGVRMEPGELETALLALNGVTAAVAMVREDVPGQRRLVAYVTGAVDGAALRLELTTRLPPHLVPAVVVVLPALPLSPNQKVDRAALPAPEPAAVATFVAPGTPTEERLADLWREVLGRERIGVDHDFFALGGNSLMSLVLLARIKERLGVALSVPDLFRNPTVERMARLLERGSTGPAANLVELPGGEIDPPLFLVHGGGGDIHRYRRLAHTLAPRRVLALRAVGLDPGEAPIDTIEAMATRYLAEVRRVQPTGSYLLGGWSMGGLIALEMALQLETHGARVAHLALIDSYLVPPQLQIDRRALQDDFVRELAGPAGRMMEALSPDDRMRLLSVFEANTLAWSRYRPARAFAGPATLYVAQEGPDPAVRMAQFQTRLERAKLVSVPGDHHRILEEASLAASLASELNGS
jgi:amino acid adenylation domain-containing protein